ncbi:MAG: VanW family protein [Coriobacteriia bacterium]|nr:VanW family protein [Coriobacteriia bacterium]
MKLKKIRRQRILISVAIVLAVLVMMVAIDLVGNAGKIHNGVEVDGIALGGKTPAKARAYLTSELHRGQDKPIKVTYGQQSWQISPADLGVKYDTAQMVSDAWKIGRESNIFKATTMRIISYFHPQTVMLQIDSDPAKESTLYDKITIVTNKSPVNASVTLKDGTFVASGGSDGTALQKQTLTNLITYASLGGQKTVKAPVEIAHRTIDLAKAQLAAKTAQDATKDMIAAQYQDKTWQLEPKVLSGLIIFKLSNDLDKNMAQLKLENQKGDTPSDITLVPIVGSENVAKSVIPLLGATVGTAPVDASFQAANGEVTIIPSKNGLGADPVKLANELATQMQSTTATKKVTVVTHEVAPALTTAKAQALGIKERISTYTTYFSGGNKARLTNITLMAKAFDGTIVMPGKTFSLNGTVGEANAAKGYQEAGAIVDGQPTSQVGGGICQVNTTLFNAALFAGVRITERTNHSLFISSYPLGRDAAVSWPSPDFKFVNSLDHAILIVTSSSNSSVTVSFYGMDPGYTVELGPASWLSHTQAPEQRVNDPTLPAGTEKIKQPGRGGGRVTFTQTVKRADGSIVFTKTFVSNYKTEAKIILVGTKPVSATPAPTPAPTPTKTANSTR